jgi:hypothetical protein
MREMYLKNNTKIDKAKKSGERKVVKKVIFMNVEREVELFSKFDMSGFDKETIIEWYRIIHLG